MCGLDIYIISGRSFLSSYKKRKQPHTSCAVCFRFTFPALSVLVEIFLSRCHPAPDVALGLVDVEDLAGLAGKGRVDLG